MYSAFTTYSSKNRYYLQGYRIRIYFMCFYCAASHAEHWYKICWRPLRDATCGIWHHELATRGIVAQGLLEPCLVGLSET